MFCFSFSCADFIFLHGNFLLTRFNFSIKIPLAKKTLLFWILLCYLLNMSSSCIGNISWCCLAVPLSCCSSHVSLFCGIPIVLSVFRCSASVPVYRQRFGVQSLFRCSAGARCSMVPSSGLPGFIVCPPFSVDKLENFLLLISNEVCDWIPNILWIYFQVFELGDL